MESVRRVPPDAPPFASPRWRGEAPADVTTISSPSPLERLQLREQLQELWRQQVEILAVVDDRAGRQRRAAARADLLEVEAAMQRLNRRCYGTCEQCSEPIPTEDLLAAPQRRRCSRCDGLASSSAWQQ